MTARPAPPAPSLANEHKPRVWIVDDYALSNQVMTLALRSRGYPCIAVTSEAQALVLVKEFKPDVVSLERADRMAREVERAARLRGSTQANGRSIRIAIVTQESGLPSAEVLERVAGYFTKPVTLESLEWTLERMVVPLLRSRAG